ncbi:MAG: hypothetical protein WC543_00030 [Candidatus Omnitrophota bacterium]
MNALRKKIKYPSLRGAEGDAAISFLFLIIFMFLVFVIPSKTFALSLAVEPDEILVENVALGKPVAVSALAGEKMKLKIINKDATSCIYTIEILRNEQTTAPLTAGYVDIPQAAWIYPQVKEIKISGKSFEEVELFINIPKDKKYAGQKYQVVIEIKTKKRQPKDLFVLAGQIKINFSTATYAEAKNVQK